MKRNVKKALFVLGLGLMTLPLGAGDCFGPGGGDAGVAECELDTDCEGDTARCHDFLLICEDECTADADCLESDRPVCNMPSDPEDNTSYVLNVDGIKDLCICDADSCGDGMMCDDATGTCVEGEDEGCTADTDCESDETCNTTDGVCECSTPGDERLDPSDSDVVLQVCLGDGTWAEPCSDDGCYDDAIELCQDVDADATDYNMCVPAEDLTADCTEAAGESQSGTTPTIYDVEMGDPTANGCDVGGPLTLRVAFISVYSTVDLTGVTIHDVVNRPGFDAGGDKFFQDSTASVETDVLSLADDGFPNDYLVTAYICGNPDGAAAMIDLSSDGGGTSNTYCFDPQP
jgi:hypothetical protein